MKKSLFYAMNYDMPDVGVFPMHCSCNTDMKGENAALFFGLSGTARRRSADQPQADRRRRAWLERSRHAFNFEGGCYAKCIKLSKRASRRSGTRSSSAACSRTSSSTR